MGLAVRRKLSGPSYWRRLTQKLDYEGKIEIFRSVNENIDEHELLPREVWYFGFVLVLELT